MASADLYEEAVRADQEGIPEVSIQKLRDYLSGPGAEHVAEAKLLLAKCLLATNQPAAALQVLDPQALSSIAGHSLSAEALLRSGRWAEAETMWSEIVKDPNAGDIVEARLGLAEAQQQLGASHEALQTLAPLIKDQSLTDARPFLMAAELELQLSDFKGAQDLLAKVNHPDRFQAAQKEALSGRLSLVTGDLDAAEKSFQQVLTFASGQGSRVATIARLGLANTYIARKEYEEAESIVEKIIGEQAQTENLPDLFQALYSIYLLEQTPSLADLTRWAQEDPKQVGSDRPVLAQFYLGKLELKIGSRTNGLNLLRQFITDHASHPLASAAVIALAQQLNADGNFGEAVGIARQWLAANSDASPADRDGVQEVLASALVQEKNFASAFDLYTQLSREPTSKQGRFLYNAAVCALRLGDETLYQQSADALARLSNTESERAALEFEKAMLEAKTGSAMAEKSLRQFLIDFPDDPHRSRAHLALAEIAFTQSPSNRSQLKSELTQVSTDDSATQEEKARLEFFAAADDASQPIATVSRLAQDFIQKYPHSHFRPEIRIKLGEVYFRQDDYPNAQTQFELVSEEDPDSPLLETALFLAGEAARKSLNSSSMDHAVELFEDVYKLNGPLRFRARLEQALTKRQALQDREAIVLLNDLVNQNIPTDIRCEAMDAKGDAEFTLGSKDETEYREAIKTFDSLAALEGVSAVCRQSALYKKAKCYEKIGQWDEALAAYYDVLSIDYGAPGEIWYFRAGFDAAQILESKKSWASAAAIYQKLAATPSSRAEEAKNRLTRLRLEHFLWPE
ncbi:MAG: tetratricopeptide repeat protein [Verrucomicrobia bacterium]|nr:tetratricopeptide repeat protein [Verrucomicrobiota bacterium]MBV8484926.1 tetratricopeptide repeat protein [Verrucomicrobiota bacterium]